MWRLCAMGEELWLAPDCRQGRAASFLSLSTPRASWGRLPAGLGGRKAGRKAPPELVSRWLREEKVSLHTLGAFLIADRFRDVKGAFEPSSPHSQSGAMRDRLRWSSEVTQAERQDPHAEAKSQLWFLIPWYSQAQFHSGSGQCGAQF